MRPGELDSLFSFNRIGDVIKTSSALEHEINLAFNENLGVSFMTMKDFRIEW